MLRNPLCPLCSLFLPTPSQTLTPPHTPSQPLTPPQALYELPEAELTPERLLALADEVETHVQVGGGEAEGRRGGGGGEAAMEGNNETAGRISVLARTVSHIRT